MPITILSRKSDQKIGRTFTGLFGSYLITGKINESKLASVYAAHDSTNCDAGKVAVKFMLDENSGWHYESRICIINEAGALAAIHHPQQPGIAHPNIVKILDFKDGRLSFIVMEFLEGESVLARLYRTERINWQDAKLIILEVCGALIAAHNAGIIHGDVKAGNVFLLANGRVKLLDFSMAAMEGETPLLLTRGFIGGTYPYLAPELFTGRYDHRIDVYALGGMMYLMLCGSPPFSTDGLTIDKVRNLHALFLPTPPRKLFDDIPEAAERIIMRALSKNPDNRFQTMEEMKNAVLACR